MPGDLSAGVQRETFSKIISHCTKLRRGSAGTHRVEGAGGLREKL